MLAAAMVRAVALVVMVAATPDGTQQGNQQCVAAVAPLDASFRDVPSIFAHGIDTCDGQGRCVVQIVSE